MNVIVSFLLAALMIAGLASGVPTTTTTNNTSVTTNSVSDGGAPMPLCGPDDPTCKPGQNFPR